MGAAELPAREKMECDAVIVGAGPAGLCAAIRLMAQAKEDGVKDRNVIVLEKGSEVGAHILSGAVIDPKALDELLPDWRDGDSPLSTPATKDSFRLLTEKGSFRLPVPKPLRNKGCYVASLGSVCRWLGRKAEDMGATILPGFAATEVLLEDGVVRGVATGDMGLDSDGKPTARHQRGVEIRARQTILAEGCRGSLTGVLEKKLGLAEDSGPRMYGIGIKELWEVPEEKSRPGEVLHTVGWPLRSDTYGGSFLYHLGGNKVSVGLVVGLDYPNPHLSPFSELQRLKHHPLFRSHLEGGKRIGYGARALNEGGIGSVPRVSFPGGCLVGCGAGFMNAARLKGTHIAMKTGMLAADAVHKTLKLEMEGLEPGDYAFAVQDSWVGAELKRARNVRPGFKRGLWLGLLHAAVDSYLFRGRAPWTLRNEPDHDSLKHADEAPRIYYPKPDGKLSFDRESSVYLSSIRHDDGQPNHLLLRDPAFAIEVNLKRYASPETRYCPAGVYEIEGEGKGASLRINSQNCVHCKTCDIMDPMQNITWVPPEGGSGPNYQEM